MTSGESPQRIAARLTAHIQAEGLGPNDRLGREDELAEQFGTSRIVLREALRMLAGTHLIRTSKGPGGGVFVADTLEGGLARTVSKSVGELLDVKAISATDLLEARIAIEAPLAAIAASEPDSSLPDVLSSLIDIAQTATTDRTVVETAGAAFHRAIANAASNRLVGAITSWIYDVLEPELARRQDRYADQSVIVAQHRKIRDAVAQRDPEAADQAMRDHLLYLGDLARLPPRAPDKKI